MSAQTWPWAGSHQNSGWPWPLEVSTSSSLAKWGDYRSISAKVRQFLHSQQPLWPSVDKVAAALSMSRRTLLRKLETEKISYQQLLDEARNELACWYLRQSSLPLSHIAEKIGFSDQTNFSRSFKRWRGDTPKSYRQQFAQSTRV